MLDTTPLQDDILHIMQTAFPLILAEELPVLLEKFIPPILEREVPAIIKREVPAIVKAETADIRKKVYRLEVLYEDLDHRFRADSELLRSNLKVKDQVDNHENRLTSIESTQSLLKKAVTEHSKQLKPNTA